MRVLVVLWGFFLAAPVVADNCVECHRDLHPGVVKDWLASAHQEEEVGCASCHGDQHQGPTDVHLAQLPEPETCGVCHPDRLTQYRAGKHGAAWVAVETLPGHGFSGPHPENERACAGCHQIGTKPLATIQSLAKQGFGYGRGSCDACHTRHLFSIDEARSPQACKSCHLGYDHPQWEMFAASKHGVRAELAQNGVLSEEAVAVTCQSCHMEEGNHEVRTAWGFYGVRWPLERSAQVDPQWAEDQRAVLRALGMLDADGKTTWRFAAARVLDLFRLDDASFDRERDRMVAVCSQCHARDHVMEEFEAGDELLRRADRVMAQAIEIVAGLYEEGMLQPQATQPGPYPDLLGIGDGTHPVEFQLWRMFFEHRGHTFMGRFHSSVDHSLWKGWVPLREDLVTIQQMAAEIRRDRIPSGN